MGSGCSLEPPSSIPSTGELKARLAEALNGSIDDRDWCRQHCGAEDPKLEEIAQAGLTEWGSPGLYARSGMPSWMIRKPNEVHRLISKLCAESLVTTIVTTNYDTLIEKCLTEELKIEINPPLVLDSDWQWRAGNKISLIKLHGTVDRPETIRLASSQFEGWSTSFARDEWTSTLRNLNVVFLAYSSSDPQISSAVDWVLSRTQRDPIWVVRSRQATIDEAIGRISANANHQIVGDVKIFLTELWESCFSRRLANVIEAEVRPMAESYFETETVEAVVAQAREISRMISPSLLISDYFKVYRGTFEEPYLPTINSNQVLGTLLFWMALLRHCLGDVNGFGTNIGAFQEGFHLEGNLNNASSFGILLMDTSTRSPDACLGMIQGWLNSSGGNELEAFPRLRRNPAKLMDPNRLMIVLVGSSIPSGLTVPLSFTTPFYKELGRRANAVCLGSVNLVPRRTTNADGVRQALLGVLR